ncbi:MAG TPA: hypothetical protein VJ913_07100 [Actinomycetota bacterium]|nr:hypothetical protein [Actinomycetota bacterium]
MALDERLRRELEQAGRLADPSGVYEDLIRRRERRRVLRKVQAATLAVAVVLGSIGGFYALTRIFGGSEAPNIAAASVANGEIVFSLPLESGGEHLFSVQPDGTNLRQLTDGDAVHRSPDVSPDGRMIVFAYSVPEAERMVLATMPADGGPVARPTENRYGAIVRDPAWSPDGDRIAFVGSVGGGFGIVVFDVQTSDARLIPGTDNLLIGSPTWSPDGETIAFEGGAPDPADQESFPWDIYSVRVDGSELTNLTRTPDEGETSPAWSSRLNRIAFVRGRGPSDRSLYTMAPDGSNEAFVFDALPDLDHPAWSPDGRFLAFSADTGQVYTIPADGGEPAAIAGAMGEPAWRHVSGSPTPSIEPSPSPSAEPPVGRDIGLGFSVCNVSSIEDEFAEPGVTTTVFVATRMGDTGGCPQPREAFNVVALDADGDGFADSSFGPVECTLDCRAFSAPDIDGDGTDELLVAQDGGAVIGLRLYDFITGRDVGVRIVPVDVAEPGDPEGGFQPGQQASFLLGGDAFELYGLQCGQDSGPDGPGIVATSAESLPNDSPDAEWHAHQTTLVLRQDAVTAIMHVVDVRDFNEPVTDDPGGPSFRSGETLCGSNLGPVAPIP